MDILIHSKFIAVLHKGDTKYKKKRIWRNTTDLSPQEQIVKRWYPIKRWATDSDSMIDPTSYLPNCASWFHYLIAFSLADDYPSTRAGLTFELCSNPTDVTEASAPHITLSTHVPARFAGVAQM